MTTSQLIRAARVIALSGAALALGTLRPSAQSAPSGLSDVEQRVVRAVDTGHSGALELLERAVNINSGTQNFDGVRQVGQLFRAELDALGFKTEWLDGAAWNRAGHLVAEHPGPG